MKKIICLLILLTLAPGAHADKKKKNNNGGGSAPAKAPGGGGGGGGGKRPGGGGGFPGMQHSGQPANRSGASHTRTHSAPSTTGRAGGAGAGKSSSNPLMRKGGAANGNKSASNPLTHKNQAAGGKKVNPLTTKNGGKQGNLNARNGGKLNKNNPNALHNNRGQMAQNGRGVKNANGNRNWQRGNHANYHVRSSHEVFHNYRAVRHDRYWYGSHYDRVVVVGGGYYYWDAGYWYPAWGYDPAFSFYVYDGPIYSYDNLPPDQVTMNVQTALQDEGYYTGEIDGQVGPKTRDALGAYQSDHSLEVTSAVDEPTVEALGLSQNT